jgi:hypothetical protein
MFARDGGPCNRLSLFLALSGGPTSIVVPIYGMFIVGGAVPGLVFRNELFTFRKASVSSLPRVFILSQAIRRGEALKLLRKWQI